MKILTLVNGRPAQITPIAVSGGVTDSSKVFQTDATGKIDPSFMPVGVISNTVNIIAFEALTAGDFVNIYVNTGVTNVRRAQGSSITLEAHGYVLVAVAAAAMATVYNSGDNTAQSGMTAGLQFLSDTSFGKTQLTPPIALGTIAQTVGVASSATALQVRFGDSYTN